MFNGRVSIRHNRSENLIIYNRREYESNAMESVQSRVKINK